MTESVDVVDCRVTTGKPEKLHNSKELVQEI